MVGNNLTLQNKIVKVKGVKGKIYKLTNSSSQVIIHKRTVPENFEFENKYLCVLKTEEGLVKFKRKRFKHKNLIKFKIPKPVPDVYLTDEVTNVNISVIYNDKENSCYLKVVEEKLSDDSYSFFHPKCSIILYLEGGDA